MLLKKSKQFLIGVLVGAIVFSSINVFADIQSIQVLFNGIKVSLYGKTLEMKDAKGNALEPLVYNGTTYLPARALCEALNKDIKMNELTNTLEITNKKSSEDSVGNKQDINYHSYKKVIKLNGKIYLYSNFGGIIVDENKNFYSDGMYLNSLLNIYYGSYNIIENISNPFLDGAIRTYSPYQFSEEKETFLNINDSCYDGKFYNKEKTKFYNYSNNKDDIQGLEYIGAKLYFPLKAVFEVLGVNMSVEIDEKDELIIITLNK